MYNVFENNIDAIYFNIDGIITCTYTDFTIHNVEAGLQTHIKINKNV